MIEHKFREMTIEEKKKFKLFSCVGPGDEVSGEPLTPVWTGMDVVWAMAVKENTPTYEVYDCGTNDLRIFKYDPLNDFWCKIELDRVKNLYGLVWQLASTINFLRDK